MNDDKEFIPWIVDGIKIRLNIIRREQYEKELIICTLLLFCAFVLIIYYKNIWTLILFIIIGILFVLRMTYLRQMGQQRERALRKYP